ncbi:Hypothetical predicted protein [Pelobates cultripes]|uniref:Uncharacterized protein n=1 Tax=Pelobates cultripes TaxID=61616 RepID=A0AAD1WJ07_PELCU|nr:Hypothetical predicted protein [Pelobates cultripes]
MTTMMKVIAVCVLLVAVLSHGADVASPKETGFKCHYCKNPEECLRNNSTVCDPGETVCMRSHRNITDPDGNANNSDYPNVKDILVLERTCFTKDGCDIYKKKSKLFTVKCCMEPFCNA